MTASCGWPPVVYDWVRPVTTKVRLTLVVCACSRACGNQVQLRVLHPFALLTYAITARRVVTYMEHVRHGRVQTRVSLLPGPELPEGVLLRPRRAISFGSSLQMSSDLAERDVSLDERNVSLAQERAWRMSAEAVIQESTGGRGRQPIQQARAR